jgi:hypothetical protein
MTMMPLTCVACGGALQTTATAEIFRCTHCRQLLLLSGPVGGAPYRTATKLTPLRRWIANCRRPGDPFNWQGGALYLTEEALAFVPHAFNFGPIERAVLRVGAVSDMRLHIGIISDELTVTLADDEAWGFRVYKGQQVYDAINERRASQEF